MRYLIEDAVKLRLNFFPKKILTRPCSGTLILVVGITPVEISYEVKEFGEQRGIKIEYKRHNRTIQQTIMLDCQDITFGTRPYFLCPCCGHKRGNILYLRPDRDKFACRTCHGLAYELTRLNKRLHADMIIYINHSVLRIKEKIELCRIYAGKKTRRTIRFEIGLDRWLNNQKVRQMSDRIKQTALLR